MIGSQIFLSSGDDPGNGFAAAYDADATVAVLDQLVAERPTAPRFLRVTMARADRQRPARLVLLHRRGDQLHRPGSPWQNHYVESFGSRLRNELLAVEALSSLLGPGCARA